MYNQDRDNKEIIIYIVHVDQMLNVNRFKYLIKAIHIT